MHKKNKLVLISFVLVAWILSVGFMREDPKDQKKTFNKPNTNDFYTYIAINQIKMFISNNGDGSYDPVAGNQGFFWPGGENAQIGAIFEDGLIWGGKVGGEVRVNGSAYRHGLQAGPIDVQTGKAADPSDPKSGHGKMALLRKLLMVNMCLNLPVMKCYGMFPTILIQ